MAACQHINILINIKQLTFYLSLSLLTAEHTRCIQIKKKNKQKKTDKLFKVKKCESKAAHNQRVCVRLVGHCINGASVSDHIPASISQFKRECQTLSEPMV